MKTRLFNKLLILFSIQLIFVVHINAEEITKKIQETYSTSDNTVVNLENKFGDIDIQNWDKNSIQIDVLITVDASSHSKAEEIMKKIDVSISQSGDNVYAKTELDGSFNNVEFSINYKIKMPKNLVLNLENKFGSVFINELSNKFNVEVKYGALTINSLTGDDSKPYSQVSLMYCKGSRIDNCNYIKLDLGYSKLSVGNANAVISSTKYSKLAVKNANLMVADSKYDNYKIGYIKAFKVEAAYSDFEIEKLDQILRLSTKYTQTDVSEIPAGFKKIEIENAYGTINLGISPNASYKLNAEAQYAKIEVPESNKLNKKKDNTEIKYWGTVGSGSDDATVDINTKYGNVNLIE